MAAIAPGSGVVVAASVVGPPVNGLAHAHVPLLGVVESGTTSPTVAWADGTRTAYTAVHSGPSSVLFSVNAPTVLPVLDNFVVQPTAASGIPNPGGRVQGPVAAQWQLQDPTGTVVGDFVVVETPIGIIVCPYAAVAVVPNA